MHARIRIYMHTHAYTCIHRYDDALEQRQHDQKHYREVLYPEHLTALAARREHWRGVGAMSPTHQESYETGAHIFREGDYTTAHLPAASALYEGNINQENLATRCS